MSQVFQKELTMRGGFRINTANIRSTIKLLTPLKANTSAKEKGTLRYPSPYLLIGDKMKQKLALFSILWLGTMVAGSRPVQAHGYPGDTIPAAHAFAQAADHFHHVIENVAGYSHLAQDIHALAQAATHFHHAVEGGAEYDHAVQDFQRLSQAYQHVRTALYHAHNAHHNQHVMHDWYEVEYTFEDLEWSL